MNGFFSKEELSNAKLTTLYSSTKGSPVFEITGKVKRSPAKVKEDALYDLQNDSHELHPCDNDLIAIGAMKAFKEKGYRIPQDVGFVGFDNSSLCELFEPSLTTINVPKYEIGQLVIRQLHHLIHHPTSPITKIEVQTNLIRRNSL